MSNDILIWDDEEQKYIEFHKIDKFTKNTAIDIDFGYWLVNNYRWLPSNNINPKPDDLWYQIEGCINDYDNGEYDKDGVVSAIRALLLKNKE